MADLTFSEQEELERFKNARSVEGEYIKARWSIATTALESARDGTKFIVTAASAIVTVYTGVLAAVFVAKDNPLPQRGVWAAIFFGLSIVLAALYLAPLRKSAELANATATGDADGFAELDKLATDLTVVTSKMSTYNRSSVRGSVVALALGVAFMAAPFLGHTASGAEVASAPPLPQTTLTGDAAKAYGYQVEIYRQALCKSSGSQTIVNDCGSIKPTTATPQQWTHWHTWDEDRWVFVLAMFGLLIVAIAVLTGGDQPLPTGAGILVPLNIR